MAAALIVASLLTACGGGQSATAVVRIPRGAGGIGFLPLLVMEKQRLIEQHAAAAGVKDLQVQWIDLGGPSVLNDALLSGAADFIAAGPPAFITLWDRTADSLKVKGVAAMAALPMYLNARAEHLRTLDDLRQGDKVAMTAIKVSIPALVMQMYAARKYGTGNATRFDAYTVSMTHPDGVVALLSGGAGITAHFTSPPFHQRERRDPNIRTVMTSDDVLGGSTTFTMLSTTERFRTERPAIYRAVLAALEDANARIAADHAAAAKLFVESGGEGGFSAGEIATMLGDPAIVFTTAPRHVLTYATFMRDIGTITRRAADWKELFFPEIHGASGS